LYSPQVRIIADDSFSGISLSGNKRPNRPSSKAGYSYEAATDNFFCIPDNTASIIKTMNAKFIGIIVKAISGVHHEMSILILDTGSLRHKSESVPLTFNQMLPFSRPVGKMNLINRRLEAKASPFWEFSKHLVEHLASFTLQKGNMNAANSRYDRRK